MDLINWIRPKGVFVVEESSYGEIYHMYSFLSYDLAVQQYKIMLRERWDGENMSLFEKEFEENVTIPTESEMINRVKGKEGSQWKDCYFYWLRFHTEVTIVD